MDWLLPQDYSGHPIVYMLVAAAAIFTTGFAKGGFAGMGVLAVPLMLTVAPPRLVLGMWLPLLVIADIFTMQRYPSEWSLRPLLRIAPWTLLGVIVGWFLLGKLEGREDLIKCFVGALCLGFVALEYLRSRVARRVARETKGEMESTPWKPNWLTASPFGLGAGVATMLAHAAGGITTIYFILQKMDRRTFVGSAARFYFVFNTLKVPFQINLGYINQNSLLKSIWLLPLIPASVWLGSTLNKRISNQAFHKIIYLLLACTGTFLLYQNAW